MRPDALARFVGVPVHKALDPNKPRDLERIMAHLSDELAKATGPASQRGIQEALETLDVDWASLSAAQREQVFVATQSRLALVPSRAGFLPRVQLTLLSSALDVMGKTKGSNAKLYKFSTGVDVTAGDTRAAMQASRLQAAFVRDQYGKRSVALSNEARSIVATGLAEGEGRTAIAARLEASMSAAGASRSTAYWDVVAAAQVNNARMLASLRQYADNGVEHYVFQAIMDEVTSLGCRLLHDKRFSVARGLATMESLFSAETPDAAVAAKPWLAAGRDDNGTPVVYYKNAQGERVAVADIEESGMGRVDAKGKFRQRVDDDALHAAGITVPPLHGNCRSGIFPDV